MFESRSGKVSLHGHSCSVNVPANDGCRLLSTVSLGGLVRKFGRRGREERAGVACEDDLSGANGRRQISDLCPLFTSYRHDHSLGRIGHCDGVQAGAQLNYVHLHSTSPRPQCSSQDQIRWYSTLLVPWRRSLMVGML